MIHRAPSTPTLYQRGGAHSFLCGCGLSQQPGRTIGTWDATNRE